MSSEAQTTRPWWEALREGQTVSLAFVKIDRSGSTQEWKDLPDAEVQKRRGRYVAGVELAARNWDAAQPLHPQGDGVMLFFADGKQPAPIQAFRAAKDLWQRVRVELNMPARISVHAGVVPWNPDTGKLACAAIDVCGHLEADGPVNAIALSEDVYLVLPEPEQKECARLGVTKRDGLPAYVFPASAASQRDPKRFLKTDDLDLWDAFRKYARSPEVRKLRYVGLRLVRKEPPMLNVEDVFVPLEVERWRPRGAGIGRGMRERKGSAGARTEREHDLPFADLEEHFEAAVVEPFEEAFRQRRGLVVIGEPGSGKTTLLRWLAVVVTLGPCGLRTALGLGERLLPLPISVGVLAGKRRKGSRSVPVLDAMVDYFRGRNVKPKELAAFLDQRLRSGDCLVLLDGLDEVKTSERDEVRAWLETFAAAYPRNRFVVSSRPAGYSGFSLPDGEEVRLQPFSDEQIERYVRAFTREYWRWETGETGAGADAPAEDLLTALKGSPRLHSLARNPFLLSALALIHRAEGRLPRHRVQFYHIFARCLCESWASARRLVATQAERDIPFEEQALPIMGRLALELHADFPSGLAPKGHVIDALAKIVGERDGIPLPRGHQAATEFLSRAQEVQVFLERGPDLWGFMHLTFQEYFVAAGLLADERFEDVAIEHLLEPRWEEVIRLGVGYMALVQNRPKAAEAFVERVLREAKWPRQPWAIDILELHIPLATLLAAEAGQALSRPLQEDIASRYAEWYFRTDGASGARVLTEVALTDYRDTLGRPFIARLAGGSAGEREHAAAALRELGASEAVPALLKALEDENPLVRERSASALGALKASEGVPGLITALKDEALFVRGAAARALGALKASEATPSLREVLEDNDKWVRETAAIALRALGQEEAVPALISVPRPSEAVPALLTALKNQHGQVRAHAAEKLGDLRASEAVPALIDALRDEEWLVRQSAASALGALKASEAVPALLNALQDKGGSVRFHAMQALIGMVS